MHSTPRSGDGRWKADLGEELFLVNAARPIREGVSNEHQPYGSLRSSRREIIRPHGITIYARVCKETIDILVGFEDVGAGRIRGNENWVPESQHNPQEHLREDKTQKYKNENFHETPDE